MEFIQYPTDLSAREERADMARHAAAGVAAAYGSSSQVPPICFIVGVGDLANKENARAQLRSRFLNARDELSSVAATHATAIFLGAEFTVGVPDDVGRLSHMSSALAVVDVVVVVLSDPMVLEGCRHASFADVVRDGQLLLIRVDACLAGDRRGSRRAPPVDPRAFVLPSKLFPKARRFALLCSYGLWLCDACRDSDALPFVRQQLRDVQQHMAQRLRVPLLTGFGGVYGNELQLRNLRDAYALLGALCGSSADLHAEAQAVVMRAFHGTAMKVAAVRRASLENRTGVEKGGSSGGNRKKASRRDEDFEIDGDYGAVFELIEDTAVPKKRNRSEGAPITPQSQHKAV